jgi:hypothetical protein
VKVAEKNDEANGTNLQKSAVEFDDEKILQLKWEHLQKVDQHVVATQRAYARVALIIQRADRDLPRMESLAQVGTTTTTTPADDRAYNVILFHVCLIRMFAIQRFAHCM